MNTVQELDRELARLENKLESVEGTPTEVYTRIVGYYRSLKNWNKGKREEYDHRQMFKQYNQTEIPKEHIQPQKDIAVQKDIVSDYNIELGSDKRMQYEMQLSEADTVSYMYFYRKTCPNCPPVRNILTQLDMNGVDVDVDSDNGLSLAQEYGVMASPTAIFFSAEGTEIFRTNKAEEIENRFANAGIAVSAE